MPREGLETRLHDGQRFGWGCRKLTLLLVNLRPTTQQSVVLLAEHLFSNDLLRALRCSHRGGSTIEFGTVTTSHFAGADLLVAGSTNSVVKNLARGGFALFARPSTPLNLQHSVAQRKTPNDLPRSTSLHQLPAPGIHTALCYYE